MPIATFLASFCVPESPIWLVQNGRYYDSDKVLARMKRSLNEFTQEVTSTFKLFFQNTPFTPLNQKTKSRAPASPALGLKPTLALLSAAEVGVDLGVT